MQNTFAIICTHAYMHTYNHPCISRIQKHIVSTYIPFVNMPIEDHGSISQNYWNPDPNGHYCDQTARRTLAEASSPFPHPPPQGCKKMNAEASCPTHPVSLQRTHAVVYLSRQQAYRARNDTRLLHHHGVRAIPAAMGPSMSTKHPIVAYQPLSTVTNNGITATNQYKVWLSMVQNGFAFYNHCQPFSTGINHGRSTIDYCQTR